MSLKHLALGFWFPNRLFQDYKPNITEETEKYNYGNTEFFSAECFKKNPGKENPYSSKNSRN